MNVFSNMKSNWNAKISSYQALDSKDKKTFWKEALINNAMYILIIVAIIYTQAKNSYFLKPDSIVNIISLSAANIPIACGIAGCIVLTGTEPFCRTSSRSDRMYFRIVAAVCNLCYKNVPGSSGYAALAGYPDCHRSGRSGRLG